MLCLGDPIVKQMGILFAYIAWMTNIILINYVAVGNGRE